MLLAEGAVDIAAEPELELWDMAALDIIVREAGGTFTSLAGQPGPWGPNALATNGRLHDAAMAYLGHFPDDGPPDASWTDEPEDADDDRSPATTTTSARSTSPVLGRPGTTHPSSSR